MTVRLLNVGNDDGSRMSVQEMVLKKQSQLPQSPSVSNNLNDNYYEELYSQYRDNAIEIAENMEWRSMNLDYQEQLDSHGVPIIIKQTWVNVETMKLYLFICRHPIQFSLKKGKLL